MPRTVFLEFEIENKGQNLLEDLHVAFWFDPDLGHYQTTRTRPIALSVRPATVIGAADVVVTESTYGDEEHPEGDPEERIAEVVRADGWNDLRS